MNAKLRNWFNSFRESLKEKIEPKKDEEPDYTADRQLVGNIIIAVLTERITVKKGLLHFPKGSKDPSIIASWHALCHYEADEDLKVKDVEFSNQQLELLEMIAFEFKDGNPLPQNIIESYRPFYKDDPISYEEGLKGLIRRLLRFINL